MPAEHQRDLLIRHDLHPGDIGRVIEQHGLIYESESGFSVEFEGYVAEGLGIFAHSHDPERERLWLAEAGGNLVGSAAIVAGEDGLAQFRWFLVHPDERGQGLGRRLLEAAIEFARAANYRGVYLWTVDVLPDAARLYQSVGFLLSETLDRQSLWGRNLCEQRYDLPFQTAQICSHQVDQ